jgi:hypothetical protein
MPLHKLIKNEKTGGSLVPPWHPNFRNFDRLPDVKVVRTSFFVNCVAIMIALAALIYVGLQEFKLRDVRTGSEGINYWQSQIDADQRSSTKAVALYQKFQAEEKKTAEVAAFTRRDFVISDFIIAIGKSLPDNIELNSINVQDSGVTLSGIVRGTSDEASGQAETYVDQLRLNPEVGLKFLSISLTSLARGTKAGQLDFQIVLKAKNGKKP